MLGLVWCILYSGYVQFAVFAYVAWKIFQHHQENAKQEKMNELRAVWKEKVENCIFNYNKNFIV